MFRNMRLSTFNLLNPLIISALLVFVSLFNILQERDRFRKQSETFAREYSTSQKQLLSFMVGNAIDFMKFKQSQIEQRIREELKTRIDEACRIAERLYSANHGQMSDAEIQRQILLTLESLRFNGGRGYYFVYSLDGRELLSSAQQGPGSPENSSSSPELRDVIANLARIVEEQGEGYYSYSWPRPGSSLRSSPKISFVRGFEPYDWFIGTGEYVEDMKAEIQEEVIQWIDHLRFSEVGYLWILDIDLRMIVHPFFHREATPEWYRPGGLRDYTDPQGKQLFVEMLDCCLERGSGYVSYLWSKPYQTGTFEKLSYVELINEWGWIIGAGIYVDDLERTIRQNEMSIDRQTRAEILRLVVLVACLILLSIGLTRFFHIRVLKAFALFGAHFQDAAHAQKEIDPSRLSFAEFRHLAEYVNKMVEDQRVTAVQLSKSEERLLQAQKMEAIGRLAGGIAHDFGNLTMAVHGYAEMLLWDSSLPEQTRASLEEIQKAAERAGSLTHQLLAFSRRQILQPVSVALNALIEDLEGILRRVIGEDIHLTTDLAEDLGPIKADPVQIEQVVINLAVNARDAMSKGGTLKISTRQVDLDERFCADHLPTEPGLYVLLEISDTGVGMDAHTQEHLFEPFFTTKTTGKGTGLGLSTVYGIVKQSGGYIWVASKPDHGAIFSIYFPLLQEEPQSTATPELRSPARGEGETILLVEDEELVREMIAASLRGVGFRVLEAGNGTEALRVARRNRTPRIDLILTDVVMPDIRGDELAERLPARYRDTPILFMSGYPGSRNVGSRPYIQKPFSPNALCARITELLHLARTPVGR